ncbi:HD domain-containing protein [Mycolicibacterium alvei]|uniref:HD domain-containing protein n=1 Tax=Mycolicibacterium alvei TaxID=67081 RepID=A0A6N4V1K6_9MYCO|nr:HD domain-containing protein [Mycolicibacterium alvei]BBX30468.1 hypothetical protein MALV_55930 [Mycolicibacterium alvei]
MRVSLDVERARQIAEALLADAVPRRWSHTIGVATTAAELAKVLAPESADEIVCAAWLHDIGYAPCLIDTRFHPIDGAAYLAAYVGMSGGIPAEVVGLVAHHTGAAFEAQERGLQHLLAEYAVPEAAKLAILSCADLCTGPDGSSVNPGDRLIEVLTRYPADHPVHRAITKSAPLLVAHARRVLAAAEAARNAEQRQGAPAERLASWISADHGDIFSEEEIRNLERKVAVGQLGREAAQGVWAFGTGDNGRFNSARGVR